MQTDASTILNTFMLITAIYAGVGFMLALPIWVLPGNETRDERIDVTMNIASTLGLVWLGTAVLTVIRLVLS